MKHNHVPMKLLAFLWCILILFGSVPKARAWTLINAIFITFDTSFKAGNEIPYSFTYKSDPKDSDLIFVQSPAGDNGKNGVLWEDITDKYNVVELNPYADNRFLEGHRYRVTVYPESSHMYSYFGKGKLTNAFGTQVSTYVRINDEEASVWSRGAVEFQGTPYAVGLKVWYEFEIGEPIPTAELPIVLSAAAGSKAPFRKDGIVSDSEGHCYIDYGRAGTADGFIGAERWYDVTDGKYLVSWDTFQAQHVYQYSVIITANKNWVFRTKADGLLPDVRVRTQNGIEAISVGPVTSSLDDDGLHEIVATFRILCPTVIPEIRVTGITEPDVGVYPDYSVTAAAEEYYIWHYTGNGWKDGVYWQDLTADTLMTESSRFQAGHTYRCSVLVSRINADYEFANDGTKPTVNAFIDGKQATASKSGGNDIGSTLVLYRDYTIPAEQRDIEIDYVAVLGVTGPVHGEKASYTAAAPSGADYSVWTSYETENRKNGVLWYDKTDKRYMSVGDTFALGHVYEVSVYLIPDRGYVFATLDDGRFDVEATLNDDQADVVDTGDDTELEVTYSFACVNAPVSSVSVSFEDPAAGREPDWSMDAYGEGYRVETEYSSGTYINGVYWRDDTEEQVMKPGDVFVTGHTYTVTVSLVTEEGYEFADYQNYGLTAYLNGVHADSITAWHEPEINIGLKKTYTLSSDRLPGDANADGKVDMLDALRVVQYQEMVVPINMANADVTGDGKATIEDARLIGQWAAGWNVGMK